MIDRRSFDAGGSGRGGRAGRKQVELFTLRSERGAFVRITNFGATVTELHVPDRHGALADVVLGYDALAVGVSPDDIIEAVVAAHPAPVESQGQPASAAAH